MHHLFDALLFCTLLASSNPAGYCFPKYIKTNLLSSSAQLAQVSSILLMKYRSSLGIYFSVSTPAYWSHFSPRRQNFLNPFLLRNKMHMGFPGGTDGKESPCPCSRSRRLAFDPWVRKIPQRRTWQPPSVFLPGEPSWTEGPGGLQSISLHSRT